MTVMRAGLVIIAIAAAIVSPRAAFAAQTETREPVEATRAPLTLFEVLAASAAHYPKILEALAKRSGAEGDALAARGAFDPVVAAEGRSRLSGFYDGQSVETTVKKRLKPLGATVYGGWRTSRGDFPVYEDYSFTNKGGEGKAGVILSLLRDRAIDPQRLALRNAALSVDAAEIDLLIARITVQHRAIAAYWRWAAAGRQLAIYEDLLALAEARQSGLEKEVRLGARARIFLTENAQNITRRRILATEARRDFQAAANALSLYYRDDIGAPVIPDQTLLPAKLFNGILEDAAEDPSLVRAAIDSASIAARRPEVAAIDIELARARNALIAAENELNPRLDFNYEIANDFGAIGIGGASRDGMENIVGLRFSAPFGRSAARGERRAAAAKIDALQQRARLAREEIAVELDNIRLDLDMAHQLAALAAQEAEQAHILEEAERRRFAGGASDFFLVNLREETAADAEIKRLDAELRRRLAAAALAAATVDLKRLGLATPGG